MYVRGCVSVYHVSFVSVCMDMCARKVHARFSIPC